MVLASHLEWERLRYSDIDCFLLVSSSSQVEDYSMSDFFHTPLSLKALRVAPVELVAYHMAVTNFLLTG
jgi:hypothetical protein